MIERDYQELKSEPGLSDYEGRNWRGFHHHATLCIAACGFLMLERLSGKKTLLDSKSKAGIATPQEELELASKRYRELIRGRTRQ